MTFREIKMYYTDIIRAQKRISGLVAKTELRKSVYLGNLTQGEVFLKLENLQITNAFKFRGAINKLIQIKKSSQEIITASSGNHGQAVARASRELGLKTKIILPERTPEKKKNLIKNYGAAYIIHGKTVDQAEEYGRNLAKKEGKLYISPYNDEDIVAGAGTIGLELIEQLSGIQAVLVPIGGGGLISGIAIALKEFNPSIKIFGVQPKNDAAMYYSLKSDNIIPASEYPCSVTIADGLAGGIEQNSITFSIIKKYVDKIFLVSEKSIEKAIYQLWKNERQIVEGAGAVGIAAIIEQPEIFLKQKMVVIISGGNINKDCFDRIIENK